MTMTMYKADVNDPAFNDKDEDSNDKPEYNDSWFKKIKRNTICL